MEHARNRVTFGQPIAERQAIQWMVADSAVEIEALRWLVLTAAWQVDQGIDSRQAQSMAKLYGGVKANEIVDRVLQIHGGMGYTRELPVERWYRELRLLRIYEGTDEIQRRTIARNLLKGHASVRGPPRVASPSRRRPDGIALGSVPSGAVPLEALRAHPPGVCRARKPRHRLLRHLRPRGRVGGC